MKIKYLPIIVFLVACHAFAQDTMQVVKTNGSSENIAISTSTKITFSLGSMIVSNALMPIAISDIQKIVFNGSSTSIASTTPGMEPIGASVYPNPFNPVTAIQFSLKNQGKVNIAVYNNQGQKVRTLINENKKAGNYRLTWDAKNHNNMPVATGQYILRMQMNEQVVNKKLVLLK